MKKERCPCGEVAVKEGRCPFHQKGYHSLVFYYPYKKVTKKFLLFIASEFRRLETETHAHFTNGYFIDHFGHVDIGFLPKILQGLEIVEETAKEYPNALACGYLCDGLPKEIPGDFAFCLYRILAMYSWAWLYQIEHHWESCKTRWFIEQNLHYLMINRDLVARGLKQTNGAIK